ncbi:hypothetical protein KI387_035676 [Taxus chinensis]|uniref:DUF7705 domain-containing protein n=1 Tax=Taxus chinensis TaxID=29808 RepID=A0AA38FNY5_TAXCH|nr:hypothetical protein KI387_035676 [Taxus chinensis]
MKSERLRVALEGWNQCNEVEAEAPSMGSPWGGLLFVLGKILGEQRPRSNLSVPVYLRSHLVIIMDFKRPNQKRQRRPNNEESEKQREKESKRPRTDDNRDEVREFFALVDRIQEMQSLFKEIRMNGVCARDISSPQENVGANVTASKSPWEPSFEAEDFFSPPCKGRKIAQADLTCEQKNAVSSGVTEKPDNDKYMAVRNFDLNVEPTS